MDLNSEQKAFESALLSAAEQMEQKALASGENKKANAQVCVKISEDAMEAWLFAVPPRNEGKELTEDLIMRAMEHNEICFGIDAEAVRDIVARRKYLEAVTVARGIYPVNGMEGMIHEHFERLDYEALDPEEKEKEDFNSLKYLHLVSEGDVIAEIVEPIPGIDGMTVTGEVIKAKEMEPLQIPAGANTKLNEQRTALVSRIKGTLYYAKGKFHVKNLMRILSDVDSASGDIDIIGSLEIEGDVLSGVTVKATENIHIHGTASDCTIVAGGNITIDTGVKGNGKGVLQAGGNVDCLYIESCTVQAGGVVRSDSIINCEIYSDRSVESKVLIGGNVTALQQVHVETLGNDQGHLATFYLGNTKEIRQEKIELESQNDTLEQEMKQLQMNIRLLKNKAHSTQKDWEDCRIFQRSYQEKTEEFMWNKKRLGEIQEGLSGYSRCELTARVLNPPVMVCIAGDSCMIEKQENMCRIWLEDGGIRML